MNFRGSSSCMRRLVCAPIANRVVANTAKELFGVQGRVASAIVVEARWSVKAGSRFWRHLNESQPWGFEWFSWRMKGLLVNVSQATMHAVLSSSHFEKLDRAFGHNGREVCRSEFYDLTLVKVHLVDGTSSKLHQAGLPTPEMGSLFLRTTCTSHSLVSAQ